MAEWVLDTTDKEIDEALERAQSAPEEPRILEAQYHGGLDVIQLKLSDGRRLVYPRENLQALKGSTPQQAANFFVGQYGTYIWWPDLDEGHYLPNMLEGRTGNEVWMERLRRPAVAA